MNHENYSSLPPPLRSSKPNASSSPSSINAAETKNADKAAKPKPQLLTDDKAVLNAAADLIASGEVTGKMLETTLLHKPQG